MTDDEPRDGLALLRAHVARLRSAGRSPTSEQAWQAAAHLSEDAVKMKTHVQCARELLDRGEIDGAVRLLLGVAEAGANDFNSLLTIVVAMLDAHDDASAALDAVSGDLPEVQ